MKRFLLIALFFLSACASKPVQTVDNTAKIRVLTYNVENLFDLERDPEKNDNTFLPEATKSSDPTHQNRCIVTNNSRYRAEECIGKDWSPAVLDRKLARLTDVVRQVNDGLGPDILILQEVESLKVLEKWREEHLKEMGYSTIAYVKGPDERGINPAVFSRFPLVGEPVLHEIDFTSIEPNPRPSRGILEAHLRLPDGETLAVFAVHFPSQGAPTQFRKVAVQHLMAATAKAPAGMPVLVGGDFNITSKEDYKEKYFPGMLAKEFAVSHLVGCKGCVGTSYFSRDNTWSFFDVLLFNKNLTSGQGRWQLDRDSIRIVNSSIYQMRFDGKPARFSRAGSATGVSDHWPMYAELRANEPPKVGVNP
ncbi:MAG: endonuclease/exonuclease/phosphatase family protein [Bdellovibrionales bacterium]|nr:endonuclease/exonuclease/phosphatase family protein [Bdellovibrionales bacterium]